MIACFAGRLNLLECRYADTFPRLQTNYAPPHARHLPKMVSAWNIICRYFKQFYAKGSFCPFLA